MKESIKGFVLGSVLSVVTGVVTLWLYYDYIEKKAEAKQSTSYVDKPGFGLMGNNKQWIPLSDKEIRQIMNITNN